MSDKYDCVGPRSFKALKVTCVFKKTYKKKDNQLICQPYYIDDRMNDSCDGSVFLAVFHDLLLERDYMVKIPFTNAFFKVEKRSFGRVYVIGPHTYHEECQCSKCDSQR